MSLPTTIERPDLAYDATHCSSRADALARRLEEGAEALIELARDLSAAEWEQRLPGDGRKIGVVVHHVASMYPIEIQFVKVLAGGSPITGVTMLDINAINAQHATDNDRVARAEALALLRKNSREAASAIRGLTDAELDSAAPVSLNADAPLTCQFFIEDHPLRHSYHHLARIRAALGR